jgi:hypothetical protein
MDRFIKRVCAMTAAAVLSGSAIPAFAQSSDSGVTPILISGDQSPERIAAVCGITAANIRGTVVVGTSADPGFSVQVTPNGTERINFTDTSSPDQFNGTRGVEAVGVRRNGTNVFCYQDRITDTSLDAPGTGTPNQVTVVWGPGPCPIEDVTPLCAIYNTPTRTVDFVQGHLLGTQQVNICGCPPVQAQFCDPSVPSGASGSCIPAGETEFRESEFTGSATIGTGTCETITTTIGGRIRKLTVCD